ncbi:WAP four-disulfide core domain protein 5 [Sigmodon hispidus]
MRIQSSLLLVVLLALETQLPVALCRNKGEKLGGCPPDDGPCLQVTPDQCLNDKQCPSSLKCCYRTCFRQCIPRVSVKLGNCPVDKLQCASPIKHTCNQDSDCSGKKRCCATACGRDCRDPSRGVVPIGKRSQWGAGDPAIHIISPEQLQPSDRSWPVASWLLFLHVKDGLGQERRPPPPFQAEPPFVC